MSATYRGITLPNAKVTDGSPVVAFKTWGFFGANGTFYLHGGTRAAQIGVSGIGLRSVVKTFKAFQDGLTGSFISNSEAARTTVIVVDVTFGNWFLNASDGLQYQLYTLALLELIP